MAIKAVSGKCRIVITVPEAECREYEAIARDTGTTVTDVVRMKLKGFEPRRAA
jgi:hypothetical protein